MLAALKRPELGLITDNLIRGKQRITNRSKANVVINNNADDEVKHETKP